MKEGFALHTSSFVRSEKSSSTVSNCIKVEPLTNNNTVCGEICYQSLFFISVLCGTTKRLLEKKCFKN